MKFSVAMIASLFLVASASYAGVTINGTTITFNDNSMQTTANPPSDHGGTSNVASGINAFVGGGYGNTANADRSAIVGGDNNMATAYAATVGGGNNNVASGGHSVVGGGGGTFGNTASANWTTIAGGFNNTADGYGATISGGTSNIASDERSTVGGGQGNQAIGDRSTVGGGFGNIASNLRSTVAGGQSNQASGVWSTISGGRSNQASGAYSAVAGGKYNSTSGDYSFVAGTSANDSGYNNVFVWDDGSGSDATAANTFNVWASGGIILNGVVSRSSDRDMKEAFSFVSAREVLDKVVEMPVTTWRFKSEDDSIRHIGPVAQDFMAAFGYGIDDKYITATDADGVALAAIQGLYAMQCEELQKQAEVNTALRWHNAQLEARLARLENAILRESERGPTGTD